MGVLRLSRTLLVGVRCLPVGNFSRLHANFHRILTPLLPCCIKGMLLEDLDLSSKQLIALPLNDSANPNAANSGSHWGLLLYRRVSGSGSNGGGAGVAYGAPAEFVWEFYDSMAGGGAGGVMAKSAQQIADKLQSSFNLGSNASSGNQTANVNAVKCPQQVTGYDCGVYAVAFTRYFCQQLHTRELESRSAGCGSKLGTGATLAAAVTPASITALRSEFQDRIATMLQRAP